MWGMADEFDEVVEGEAEEFGDGELRSGELPAVAEFRTLDRPSVAAVPARQVAALTATGFVAGAAVAALVRRRGGRRPRRSGRLAARRSPEELSVISTHTYLLRVHVLGRPAE